MKVSDWKNQTAIAEWIENWILADVKLNIVNVKITDCMKWKLNVWTGKMKCNNTVKIIGKGNGMVCVKIAEWIENQMCEMIKWVLK